MTIRRHAGVQREFARLVKDDLRFDRQLRSFLPRTYNLKASLITRLVPTPKSRKIAQGRLFTSQVGSWR
jgi:hypothetical protein